MPSKSKSQQRLFGMALAARRGKLPKSKQTDAVKRIADSKMKTSDIEDFARTKHKGLPNHVQKDKKRPKTIKKRVHESVISLYDYVKNLL